MRVPGGGDQKQFLSGQKAVGIFKKMREEDNKALGLDVTWALPEWMCVSVFSMPPLHVIPSVVMGGGAQSSEDDLMHQLVNIVKCNIALKTIIQNGEPNIIVEQFEQALQHNCAAFMNNELQAMRQVTQRIGRPLKTLKRRGGESTRREDKLEEHHQPRRHRNVCPKGTICPEGTVYDKERHIRPLG